MARCLLLGYYSEGKQNLQAGGLSRTSPPLPSCSLFGVGCVYLKTSSQCHLRNCLSGFLSYHPVQGAQSPPEFSRSL